MEDDAVGDLGEGTQLVQSSQDIQISAAPSIAAAAGIAGLGDPHLGTGHILVPDGSVAPGAEAGHSQIIVGMRLACLPVTGGHNGFQALGNAVVVVVGENIHGNLVLTHQIVGGHA